MELLKKNNKLKYFWVEDYTNEERDFFLELGFKEKIKEFMGEIIYKRLSFEGSAFIRTWDAEEWNKISSAVKSKFGSCKVRKLTLAELM